jgi:hypothetical protein
LEHRVDVPFVRCDPRDIHTLEADGARGRVLEAGDHPQGGGLSTSGRAEQREELTGADSEVGVLDCDVVVEPFGHVVDFNDSLGTTGAICR